MKQNEAMQRVALAREGFITKQQIAAHFHRTQRTIELWMRSGILPFFKIGRSVFFRLEDVEHHFLENFRQVRPPAYLRKQSKTRRPTNTAIEAQTCQSMDAGNCQGGNQ